VRPFRVNFFFTPRVTDAQGHTFTPGGGTVQVKIYPAQGTMQPQANGVAVGTAGPVFYNFIGMKSVANDGTTVTVDASGSFGSTSAAATYGLSEYSNDTQFPQLQFLKSRAASNVAAPVATLTGDILGKLDFQAVNANATPAVVEACYVRVVQDGSGGTSFVPSRIEWYTGTNAAAPALAMKLDSGKSLTVTGSVNAVQFGFGNDAIYHDAVQGASIIPIGGSTADVTLWNSFGSVAFYVVAGTSDTWTLGTHNASNLVSSNAITGASYKYKTGSGGTITQAVGKANGCILNKVCGQITMNAAALAAATSVSFTLTNSTITATSVVLVNIASAATANSYAVTVDAVAAGSCRIQVRNISAGSLSEALVLNFAVINSVNA
jgi:hypothetical protein